MKRTLIFTVLLATFVTIVLFASNRTTQDSRSISVGASPQIAPDFALKDLNGKTVRLSELRGKAVVLNFWATWCPPCRHEIPWFVDLQKKYGPQGLQIVGVAVDNPAAVADFSREMGINYTVVMSSQEILSQYGGVRSLPSTFYIGRDGKVLDYVAGLVGRDEVEQKIKTALATPGRGPRT